jgi:hypothetical protein
MSSDSLASFWFRPVLSFGQKAPGPVKPGIGHFEKAANVALLRPVEKKISLGRVAVASILAVEQFQRDKRVEEIARRTLVQPEPLRQIGKIGRALGKLSEQAKLHRAQKRLRRPETKPKIENIGGRWGFGHGAPLSMMASIYDGVTPPKFSLFATMADGHSPRRHPAPAS